LPDECVIVDSGDAPLEEKLKAVFEQQDEDKPRLIYLRSAPGLPHQRNVGIAASSGDIVFFFDDDVILEPDYIERVLEVYQEYPEAMGVQGTFITQSKPSRIGVYLRKLFLLPHTHGDGKMLPSGFPSYSFNSARIVRVEVMCGGNTSYRSEVFRNFKFDENLSGWAFMEDDDFSYRVSRMYALYYTPFARATHLQSPHGRDKQDKIAEMQVVNHYYFFRKNMAYSSKNCLAFTWSEIGGLFFDVVHLNWAAVKGRLKGAARVTASLFRGDEWRLIVSDK